MTRTIAVISFRSPIDPVRRQSFAESCILLSPIVALTRDGRVAVDVTRSLSVLGSDQVSAVRRVQDIHSEINTAFKVDTVLSVSTSLRKAWALAVSASDDLDEFPLELISSWNPARTDFGSCIEAMRTLGVSDGQTLKSVDPGEFVTRFGSVAREILDFYQDDPSSEEGLWNRIHPAEILREVRSVGCDDSILDLEPTLFILKSAMDPLFLRLKGRGLGALSLECVFEFEYSVDEVPKVRKYSVDFSISQSQVCEVLKSLRDRLIREFSLSPFVAPLVSVSVEVKESAPIPQGQRNFFSNKEDQQEKRNQFLERICQKLGRSNIYQARLSEAFLPEHGWIKGDDFMNWSESESMVMKQYLSELEMRPLRLFSEPVFVRRLGNRLQEGARSWTIQGIEESERFFSEWWKESIQSVRTYFKVYTSEGDLLWVYQDALSQMFIHGVFE